MRSGPITLVTALLAAPTVLAQTGSLTGMVLADAPQAIVGLSGTTIDAVGPTPTSTATGADGSYSLSLAEGTYTVTATTPGGQTASVSVDVLAGSTVWMNFTLESSDNSFLPSRGARLLPAGNPNPDVDLDGEVDFEDLEFVENNLGADPSTAPPGITGDLNEDGSIDLLDIQIVVEAFGRTVLHVPGLYQAQVTPGGSAAEIGDGLATVSSGEGHTLGHLEVTGDPAVARFLIEEDRGDATSPELGNFTFSENPANPSFILFELDTGQIVGGQMTLVLNGGVFGSPYFVDSVIPDGVITFASGGFERYHMPNVNGSLTGFPFFGHTHFWMRKRDWRKPDSGCPKSPAVCGEVCSWLPVCAKHGRCGVCATIRWRTFDPWTRLWREKCKCICRI